MMRRAFALTGLIGMVVAAGPVSSAHAAGVEDVVRDARVTPHRVEDLLFGCELGFLVLRRTAPEQPPSEAFAGSAMVLNHMSGQQAAVLRLGVVGSDKQLRPLSHGAFVGDGAETSRELIQRRDPDGSGFEMFVYGMGPQTSAFFSRLTDFGIGGITYRSDPDGAEERFRIDVSEQPELLAEWRRCLSDLAASPPPEATRPSPPP